MRRRNRESNCLTSSIIGWKINPTLLSLTLVQHTADPHTSNLKDNQNSSGLPCGKMYNRRNIQNLRMILLFPIKIKSDWVLLSYNNSAEIRFMNKLKYTKLTHLSITKILSSKIEIDKFKNKRDSKDCKKSNNRRKNCKSKQRRKVRRSKSF